MKNSALAGLSWTKPTTQKFSQKALMILQVPAALSDIDDLIEQLCGVRSKYPATQVVHFTNDTIIDVCSLALDCSKRQPMLHELETPMKLCGDILGRYHDLSRIFENGGLPPNTNYPFLGDEVDRGRKSLDCLSLLF